MDCNLIIPESLIRRSTRAPNVACAETNALIWKVRRWFYTIIRRQSGIVFSLVAIVALPGRCLSYCRFANGGRLASAAARP